MRFKLLPIRVNQLDKVQGDYNMAELTTMSTLHLSEIEVCAIHKALGCMNEVMYESQKLHDAGSEIYNLLTPLIDEDDSE